MAALPSDARCTRHADALAEASCARCGDFLCRLCGPLEPVALCPSCALKTTLDWEEPGEHGPVRAFMLTARESIGSPTRIGRRLGGSGHVLAALLYVTLSALCGLLPLSTLFAVPIMSAARPYELGLRSTSALSIAAFVVLFAIAAPTLVALCVALQAGVLWLAAGLFGIGVRYDVLLRGTGYGLSLFALPLIGPLLAPFALLQSLLVSHAQLSARSDAARASFALVLAGAGMCALALALATWLR